MYPPEIFYLGGVAINDNFYFVFDYFLHKVKSSNWNHDLVLDNPGTTTLKTDDNLVVLVLTH